MPRGTGTSRLKGLSKSIISHSFRGWHRQSHVLMAGKQSQRREAAAMSHLALVQEMSSEDCEMVENMIVDHGMDVKPQLYTAPPGEEGLDMSHAGGEFEAFEELAHEVAGISGWPYLTAQLSSAFNIYLEILHRVDQHLHMALKRDTPNWRLLNSCPACFYKLEDEPNLEFEWLVSIDGNNSLKRWDSMTYGTNAQLDS
ncbi:hypothetical protein F4604DRAFT_1935345 [Suillus subluteus]|nr:hypothetical protein F4604DRAFT_1935345 [Suillus subluteus]